MKDICKLIESYKTEAAKLFEYRSRLAKMMDEETDPGRLRALELRKSTVETERYEVIADIKAMSLYVLGKSKCRGK